MLTDNVFTLLCSCGCDNGFVFKELDGNIYVSSISSDFYTHQNLNKILHCFIKNIKEYTLVKNHKKSIVKEVCLKKEDIENLLKYLEKVFPTLNDDKVDNITKLRVFKEVFEEYNYTDYSIELLLATKNPKKIFFNVHRKYELVLNKKETLRLIKSCKKSLE